MNKTWRTPFIFWLNKNLYNYMIYKLNLVTPRFIINLFVPDTRFLFPQKTSENPKVFWYFQWVEKGCIWNELVKHYYYLSPIFQGVIWHVQHKVVKSCVMLLPRLNHSFPMHPFSALWKGCIGNKWFELYILSHLL